MTALSLRPDRVGLALILGGAAWLGGWALVIAGWGNEMEDAGFQASRALLVCLFLGAVGAFLMIRSAIMRGLERFDDLLRTHALTQPGPSSVRFSAAMPVGTGIYNQIACRPPTSLRKLPSGPLFPRLATISLILVLTLMILAIPAWLLYFGTHPTPTGLPIRLLRLDFHPPGSPGIQPLLVRVVFEGYQAAPKLFVNAQEVEQQNFTAVLKTELSRRPSNWPAYVQGDPDLEWGDVGHVIDAIRGFRAEVLLLTPKTAEQLRRSTSSAGQH